MCIFFSRYNGFVIHQLIKNVDKVLMTPFALILFTLTSLKSIQTHAMTFVLLICLSTASSKSKKDINVSFNYIFL